MNGVSTASSVAIVDTGIANFGSIESAVTRAGGKARIARGAADFDGATHIIIPGVGSFDVAMRTIDERGLRDALRQKALVEKLPTLGICLGMQLLGASSQEGERPGLGWFAGRTVRLSNPGVKVPHIGWNKVYWNGGDRLLDGIEVGERFYFVHSYQYTSDASEEILAHVEHGDEVVAIVKRDNVVGTQFHPEKSRSGGLRLLRNFLGMGR